MLLFIINDEHTGIGIIVRLDSACSYGVKNIKLIKFFFFPSCKVTSKFNLLSYLANTSKYSYCFRLTALSISLSRIERVLTLNLTCKYNNFNNIKEELSR